MENDRLIEERKKKVFDFFKNNKTILVYICLILVIILAIYIRTLPMKVTTTGHPGLWDITTNSWTLGPDLDPFLFLRWAKDIVHSGSLMPYDSFRYVPLGFNTKEELLLLPYMIAWFHDVAKVFGSVSVDESAVIFPVFMFVLTIISFFLLVRKIFIDHLGKLNSEIIAVISALFLTIIPSLLPRTIAGIPEKESAGFFFLFLALYLFISAWKSKKLTSQYTLAVLTGVTTAMMALIWGGFIYIFLTIGISLFMAFLLEMIDKKRAIAASLWIISAFIIMNIFSTRYSFNALLTSTTTLAPLAVIVFIWIHFLLFNTQLKKYFESQKLSKIPKPLITLIVSIIVGAVFVSIISGPSFVFDKLGDITKPLITPITSRLGVTVAENRQPFFNEWADSFGPLVSNIPIFFWLFFIGSIYLYSLMMKIFSKRERIYNTIAFAFFLFAIIFSRYSETSTLNGTNFASISLYMLGVLALIGTFGFYYYQYNRRGDLDKLKSLDFGLIILFSFLFFSIISARGAVRTIMVLVPPASIIVSYFIVSLFNDTRKMKDSGLRLFSWILVFLVILGSIYSAYFFYSMSTATAESYIPSSYTQQWQKAMFWVRENTPQNAVFAHWWDYGYWVQTMGNRSTVLDGGNAITYWDHLMGRHVLTTPSSYDAVDFLYSHNATHLLIDSTDIGKYSAFSTIGSDVNYDRASYITSFLKDTTQSQEMKNSTLYVYTGVFPLDEDVTYTLNGTKIFLPAGASVVRGVLLNVDKSGKLASQPEGVFIYQNNQYRIPLKYIYIRDKLIEFDSGINAGLYVIPSLLQSSQGYGIDEIGALLYLSNRTVHSELARLYLYNENDSYFKLVHSEDDFVVSQLKAQGALPSDYSFLYYGGVRGPIRIWEINYPQNLEVHPVYLQKDFPDSRLDIARQ